MKCLVLDKYGIHMTVNHAVCIVCAAAAEETKPNLLGVIRRACFSSLPVSPSIEDKSVKVKLHGPSVKFDGI